MLRLVDLEFDVVNSTADGFKVSSVDVMVDVVVVEIKTDVAEVVEVVFINSNVIVVVLVDFDEEVIVVVVEIVFVFVDDGNVVALVFVDFVMVWMSYTTFKEFRSSDKTIKN